MLRTCLERGRHSNNMQSPGPQRIMAEASTWDVGRDLEDHLARVPVSEMRKKKGK